MKRARLIIAAALGSMYGEMLPSIESLKTRQKALRSVRKTKERPLKTCLHCGSMHRHNNSFCSAECCKAWNARKHQEQ